MYKVNLNENWNMIEMPLCEKITQIGEVKKKINEAYDCRLPVDVHMPLIQAGVIKDPILADYCRDSEWIEKRSWWFFKKFSVDEEILSMDVIELVLERLDSRSDIVLNGTYLGTHRSVHYPFKMDVKKYLNPGQNELAVRITSGLEEVSAEDLAELNDAVCLESANGGEFRGDARRSFVRRPQYTVGWDWGPKVITIGITGEAWLQAYRQIGIRNVYVYTDSIVKEEKGEAVKASIRVDTEIEDFNLIGSKNVNVRVTVSKDGSVINESMIENYLITSGTNHVMTDIEIENPLLWWPNGYGDQPIYDISVEVNCGETHEVYPTVSTGIRTIELDTSYIDENNRVFCLIVNDTPVYCKGGNWIPNDFIYARVPDEKYEKLIEEARTANFNMLRVWGGGLYEKDIFYNLCDKAGILLWHDLMFACSTYPDHKQWFRDLVREELDYQTRRLRNHCSIALICGSNENHWIFNHIDNPRWHIRFEYEKPYGMYIYNILAKEVIRLNCPKTVYWNSSPYGGELPNDDSVGDVHRWHNAFMSKKMEERIEPKDYDTVESKFVSEYGFVGPCCRKTIEQYMDGNKIDRTDALWHLHSNVFERGTCNVAINKNYPIDHPEELSLDDFILYAGMVHGLMYGYSLEAYRFKERTYGGLFWMYNDAWGENGWTIIDYYMRRKIPFYAVKRALAHKKMTMRVVENRVVLQGINDTPRTIEVSGKFGYVSFDGGVNKTEPVHFVLPPHSRNYLLSVPLPDEDYKKGTIMFYSDGDEVESIWLRMDDMRNLDFERSEITSRCITHGEETEVTVSSETFVHGVYVTGDFDCTDEYFDLLPGESKSFTVSNKGEKFEVRSVM